VAPRRACDARRPQAFGLRECALGGGGGGPRVPTWLQKWAALALEFVAEEQRLLPEQLLALPLALGTYTPASARAEAKGARPRPSAASQKRPRQKTPPALSGPVDCALRLCLPMLELGRSWSSCVAVWPPTGRMNPPNPNHTLIIAPAQA